MKNQKKYLEIFRDEWRMSAQHRRVFACAPTAADTGDRQPPLVGDVRLLAGFTEPLAVAILEDLDKSWLVVPVSEFSAPATDCEILIGPRVFQMWNAFIAPKRFVAASWQVERLDNDALEDLLDMRRCVTAGQALPSDLATCVGARLVFAMDFRCAYLRQNAITSLAFKRLLPLPSVLPWRPTIQMLAGGMAASIALALAVFTVFHPETTPRSNTGESQMRVDFAPESASEILPEPECEMLLEPAGEILPAPEPPPVVAERIAASGRVESAPEYRLKAMELARRERSEVRVCEMKAAPSQTQPTWSGLLSAAAPTKDVVGYERYAEFQENDFKDPKTDPLSTFGLDVDTASYTTMRRYLTEMKRLPPKDAVRLEEFVNYFDYGYAGPTDNAPVAVTGEMGDCPWRKGHRLLRVGVQARRVDESRLPPCNLVFLIDCSGSMSWNGRFDLAIQSLRMLASKLRKEDFVSIVTYASGTEVRLPPTSGAERQKIEAVLDSLRAGGCTAGGAGLQMAYAEAKKNYRKDANNRVVLITDGDFNVGINNPQELERFIADKRDSGVFLTVMGVGCGNYQDAMMKKLANAGNGNYGFIDNLLEAKKVFLREFGGTMMTVAKDVKLQLEFNPAHVAGYRLLGYESRRLAARDFNDDKKDAGEMGAGHAMTALYEIIPASSGEAVGTVDALKYQHRQTVATDEWLTVKLRYKEPTGDTSSKLEFAVKPGTEKQPSEAFRFATAVAEAALLLRDSEHKGDASWSALIQRAKHAKGDDPDGHRAEFIRLMETAELLAR